MLTSIGDFLADLFAPPAEVQLEEQRVFLKTHSREVARENRRAELAYENEYTAMKNHLFDGDRERARICSETAAVHYGNWMRLRALTGMLLELMNRLVILRTTTLMGTSTVKMARLMRRINGRLSQGEYAGIMVNMSRDIELLNMRSEDAVEGLMEIGSGGDDIMSTTELAEKLFNDADDLEENLPSVPSDTSNRQGHAVSSPGQS